MIIRMEMTRSCFFLRLFYDLIQNKRSVKEAFQIAKSLDAEMDMFQLYENAQPSGRL